MTIPYINQILLVLVVSVLTTVLTLSGIQVFYILKELRETIRKVNKTLDDCNVITESVAKPVAGLSGFIMGLKSGSDFLRFFLDRQGEKRRLRNDE